MMRLIALLLMVLPLSVKAMEPLDGAFVAREPCAAFHSKNKRSNPGQITLELGRSYVLLGTNAPARDWVQVLVPGAPVSEARWVPRDCGGSTGDAAQRAEATDLVLALSWQPAFCEHRPRTKECRRLNSGELPEATRQLSLHGLWPQPRSAIYCGVSEEVRALDKAGDWHQLPAPQLDQDTRLRLARAMPGTASFLERHEWVKHGTCFFGGRDGDVYYDDSLTLLEAINSSAVGTFLAARVGRELRTADLRSAFDQAFGRGAGARVEVTCRRDQNRTLIAEIRVRLQGEVTENPDVGALMRAAPKQPVGCRSGVLDRAGLQ